MSAPDRPIAYLINQYPGVSHSFIRREIRALEALGESVVRVSVRGWDAPLVDTDDLAERAVTRYLLKDGLVPLLGAALRRALRQPGRFWSALKLALSMSRNAVRPWPWHLVYLAEACRLADWLDETGARHLHAHFGTNAAEVACLAHALGGPPWSFTVHGRGEADGGARLHFDRKVGDAKFVAAISAYTRSQLLREIPPPLWPKVRVVHCGLAGDSFAAEVPPPPSSPVFLTVGRLSPEKGHLILLDAFARLAADHPRARLVIAGDGDMRGEIEARIAALALGDRVRITGWIDAGKVRDALAEATALVQPSFIEGLPVVIMEAMAMGRPVIATYVAGIPELVLPGETGWLVPAGDIAALAEAMTGALAAETGTLTAMGEAGQARVRARHAIETEAAKLLRLMSGDTT